jgi:hypothetical protein
LDSRRAAGVVSVRDVLWFALELVRLKVVKGRGRGRALRQLPLITAVEAVGMEDDWLDGRFD